MCSVPDVNILHVFMKSGIHMCFYHDLVRAIHGVAGTLLYSSETVV